MFDIKKYLVLLQHFIFPQHCPVCGKIAAAYCNECLEGCMGHFSPFCSECGGWWPQARCEGSFPCFFAAVYEGFAKEFLLNLKYRNSRSLGIPMGRCMGRHFDRIAADLLLPVPLHLNSSRAFNQTELLALGISEVTGIQVDNALHWSEEFGRQVEKSGGERMALPLSAMNCNLLAGRRVVIVDDVYTTGSTLRAACEAVRCAGGEVSAAFFWCRTVRCRNSGEFDDITDALSLEIG